MALAGVLWMVMGFGIGRLFPMWADVLRSRSQLSGDDAFSVRAGQVCQSCDTWLQRTFPTQLFSHAAILSGLCVGGVWAVLWWEYAMQSLPLSSLVWSVLWSAWVLFLAIVDIRWKMVPLELVWMATLVVVLGQIFLFSTSLGTVVLGMGVPFVFFAAQSFLSRGKWLGSGDPWVALMLGASLGWPLAGVMVYGAYMATIPYLLFVFWRTRSIKGKRVAFVPFLAAGAIFAALFGETLLAFVRS